MNAAALETLELTKEDIALLLANLDELSPDERLEIEAITDVLESRERAATCRVDLIAFCQHMQKDYKVGSHHKVLARLLMEIAAGKKDRVCVNIAPRHGKSQLTSYYFAAWFIGNHPDKQVMLVSHTADLAVDFGRKVRNLIDTTQYKEVFPDVTLSADSKSAGRWGTNKGGIFFATGVGSNLAGRGADLLIIDDPHSEQDVLAGNFDVFDKAYDWFAFGARTRLMPGGRVAIVQCMTGDTPVLMGTGVEKPLRDIRPGDAVATCDGGRLTSAAVLNHTSNGIDSVFAISTTCGTVVRANERHPFLVRADGELGWVRVKNLKPGDTLVSLTGANARRDQKQNPAYATHAPQKPTTTKRIRTPRSDRADTGARTRGLRVALRGVLRPLSRLLCAQSTTTAVCGPREKTVAAGRKTERRTSNTGTAYLLRSMTESLRRRAECVLCASSRLVAQIQERIGITNCALITATTAAVSGGSCATTATSRLGTLKQPLLPVLSLSTYSFTETQIVAIEPAGREEVFDVQIERTENFIANGLVSHNTRWHQDDLTGRVVREMTTNPKADQYEVVEFPAILEVKQPDGRYVQKALWPEFFDIDALERTKASMPLFQWNAQFQQNPTGEEAAIVKREWWRSWRADKPPKCEYIIMSLDAAAEKNNRADFTALTTWGVFLNEEEDAHQIILLNSIKERYEFPELKRKAIAEYKEWEPDAFIVEKKSAGTQLFQELRRMGILVQEYTPHRGTGDKVARLNSVADIIKSGLVWVPETRWAEEVVEEIAMFPNGSKDDLVDSTVMALMRFRQGGFIQLPTDEKDEPVYPRRAAYY